MKRIGITVGLGLLLVTPAFANDAGGTNGASAAAGVDTVPSVTSPDYMGSDPTMNPSEDSDTAGALVPGDVDNANMGETGAAGAVGTGVGTSTMTDTGAATTHSTKTKRSAKHRRKNQGSTPSRGSMGTMTGTSTMTGTDTTTDTNMMTP